MSVTPEDEPKEEAEAKPIGLYAACVYVHGIGSQRRFEETCRLIDRIDAHVGSYTYASGFPIRRLSDVEARVEVPRIETDADVAYVRADLVEGSGKDQERTLVRFYEVYWAPVMAGHGSPADVLKWMMMQVARPYFTLQSPWRERARLRRGVLSAMLETSRIDEVDYVKLMDAYHEYEGLAAQREEPDGDFDGFLKWTDEKFSGQPETVKRLRIAAEKWRRRYVQSEWRNFAILTTLALAIGLITMAGIWVAIQLFQLLGQAVDGAINISIKDIVEYDNPKIAIGLFVTITLALGLGRILTEYLADVQAWATFQETDEKFDRRRRVLEEGKRTLRHVLEDPKCERITIVAHSLGTAIAQDSLLALARYNRARNPKGDPVTGPIPLEKIDHFITLGSPIDKIEYFFESFTSASHRYKRFTEDMRGDIGTVPFSQNKKPNIHWINFWDDGDVISGALQSPANRSGRAQRIDNVHVQALQFPAPGASHSAYFDDERVIDILSEAIFKGTYSFQTLPPVNRSNTNDRTPEYDSVRIASLDLPGKRRLWPILALIIPWLSLVTLVTSACPFETLTLYLAIGAATLCAVILAAWALGKRRGALHPIRPRTIARPDPSV